VEERAESADVVDATAGVGRAASVTPGTHIWDVLIPGLVVVAVGGAITFLVWKSFQPSTPGLGGEGEPTKWEPKKLRRIRGKSKLIGRAAFLKDRDHGNDLYVDED
jgi:hypothetical protein